MGSFKSIWLVDDHVLIRNGLKNLIERLGPYKVTKEFDGGEEFLVTLSKSSPPDLLILDISMPGMSGEQVMQELHRQKSTVRVLVLTLNENENQVIRLFRLGANGYLLKNCSAKILSSALQELFEKNYFHNEFLQLSIENKFIEKDEPTPKHTFDRLSPREQQFLALVCDEKELTYEEIADRMQVSTRTVDGYRESIFEKFAVKSKTGLVLFVLKHRLYDELQKIKS